MSNVYELPTRRTPFDQLDADLLAILRDDPTISPQGKVEAETHYRERMERAGPLLRGCLQIVPPEVEGVDPETVRRVLWALRPELTNEVNRAFLQLVGEMLLQEMEIQRLKDD